MAAINYVAGREYGSKYDPTGNPQVDGGKLGSVYTSVAEHLMAGPADAAEHDDSGWRRDAVSTAAAGKGIIQTLLAAAAAERSSRAHRRGGVSLFGDDARAVREIMPQSFLFYTNRADLAELKLVLFTLYCLPCTVCPVLFALYRLPCTVCPVLSATIARLHTGDLRGNGGAWV